MASAVNVMPFQLNKSKSFLIFAGLYISKIKFLKTQDLIAQFVFVFLLFLLNIVCDLSRSVNGSSGEEASGCTLKERMKQGTVGFTAKPVIKLLISTYRDLHCS